LNTVIVQKYDLPDSYLFENIVDNISAKVWIPSEICVVLGRSNNPTDSIHIDNIIRDNVPIYKRPSGGETVILSPNTLVISIAIKQSNFKGGKTYFEKINNEIISILQEYGIKNLKFKGISDIAINEVKILGSALYQNKDIVFYHAVLNVGESTELMENYLKHPNREPEYRKNRKHHDFVTSLKKEGYNFNSLNLMNSIETDLSHLQF